MLSTAFKEAVKRYPEPQWVIARAAKIHPATLSQLLTGYQLPQPKDERIIRVGEIVGVGPEDCFSNE